MSKNKFSYGSDKLTPEIAIKIAEGEVLASIDDSQIDKINKSRETIDKLSDSSEVIYGINTGFGALCNTIISEEESNELQENLLRSHAVGVGKDIPLLVSKVMMVLKIHSLSLGFSGVRLDIIQRLIFLLENDIIPSVPTKGSVGASGDLAPLAHLCLPLI
ncbi:MAG: histidine ammonia-lyase, partial [Gammaproteobacteria bacterium]|nr:histidine ammonia-lyase [Gammaproteobacteria bacterium]